MVPPAGFSGRLPCWVMKGSGRLKLVQGGGDGRLAGDAAEAGFTVLLEIWDSAMEELVREMPPDQLRVLLIIDSAGKVSLERLAGALGASTPATSRLCAGMEAAGLLRRCRGAPGSGVILIFVTASGRRLAARIREQRRAVLDYVLQSLTPDGRESLARGLSELADSPP
jgi:DNA-binding MarR family transcriptional regulator